MNFSIGGNQSTMSNSLMEDEGNGPSAKKRKLSTSSNPLTRIQAEVLQFENEKLCSEIEKLDKENQHLMDQYEKYKKEVTTLQAATADLQEHSIINAAKIKTLEDEKQKFEVKIKELETENFSMKTIKLEIKDTVEDEREASRTTVDKLNAEIKGLKNRVDMLQKEKEKLLVVHEKDTVKWQQQKEASEKEINNLRNEKTLNLQIMEKEKRKFEVIIKELEAENSSMKTIKSEIKGTVEDEREASRTTIDKLNAEIKDLKNKNGMLKNCLQSLHNRNGSLYRMNNAPITRDPKREKNVTTIDEDIELPIKNGSRRSAKLLKGEQVCVIKMSDKTFLKRPAGNEIFDATFSKYHHPREIHRNINIDNSVIELD